MWEKRRGFTPTPLGSCSSLVSQYHNTDVWTFLKLMVMIEHIKIRIPYLDIRSMLLSGQVPLWRNSGLLLWNLEDLVLVQTVSYRRKTTYHLLLIGFFHKLISTQDVGHMLHLHVPQQLPSIYAPVSYLSYQ